MAQTSHEKEKGATGDPKGIPHLARFSMAEPSILFLLVDSSWLYASIGGGHQSVL